MKKLMNIQLSAALGLALISSASLAGPFNGMHPLQSDRFTITLGIYAPETSGHFTIDDSADIDTDDTGLDDRVNMPAFAAVWRLSNNTRLQGEYFTIGNSGTQSITEVITIPPLDLEFEVGAKLKSELELDIARVFYGYSFIKNERMELGAGLGLHYIDFDASVKGTAEIGGIEVLSAEIGENAWAILPNVGGYVNYAFTSKFLVGARVDWISANIDKWDGTLWNVEAMAQYQIFDNFGVGAAYRYLHMDLSSDDGVDSWSVDLDYTGPTIFFTANF